MDNLINKTLEKWYTSDKVTEITTMIGNTGYGKTYAGGKTQEIYEKNSWPFGVVDKMGIHYVLRSYYPRVVIIGGDHGDYTLDEIDEVLPVILNKDFNFIVDLSNVDDMFAQEFVADLFEWLFEWHKDTRKPRNYMIEECDVFLGQIGTLPVCKKMITKCITKGRMFGFGFTLLSQRFTMIDKTPLGQTRNYIVFNMKLPRDLNALKQLVGEDVSGKVRRLKEGQCLIMTDEGHSVYRVKEKKSADVAMTPKIGVKFKEVKLLDLDNDVAGTILQYRSDEED